jgi:hypothetical protein
LALSQPILKMTPFRDCLTTDKRKVARGLLFSMKSSMLWRLLEPLLFTETMVTGVISILELSGLGVSDHFRL